MAGRLPPHLSHKSALVLLPPSAIAPPIEAVRRVHDKHFARWPPHINLIYPFLASPSEAAEQGEDTLMPPLKQEIYARIYNAVKGHRPFHMSLSADPPGTFSHSKRSKTVWLDPSSESVQHLRTALQTQFSECDADKRPFNPHLSIGQAHSDAGAQKLGEEVKKGILEFNADAQQGHKSTLDWYIDRVFVVERKGFHDRFKVIGTINLEG